MNLDLLNIFPFLPGIEALPVGDAGGTLQEESVFAPCFGCAHLQAPNSMWVSPVPSSSIAVSFSVVWL